MGRGSKRRVKRCVAREDLGPGEREALSLALRTSGSVLILDDALARNVARQLDIRLTGTLGILLRAKQLALVDAVEPHIKKLRASGFRLTVELEAAVLREAGE